MVHFLTLAQVDDYVLVFAFVIAALEADTYPGPLRPDPRIGAFSIAVEDD